MNISKNTNYAIDLIICYAMLHISVYAAHELSYYIPGYLAIALGIIGYFVVSWKYVGWRR